MARYSSGSGHMNATDNISKQMTKPRQAVFDIIRTAQRPMGAYDIIRAISPQPKPPTVYRALNYLCGRGLIHRIESLNAYVICRAAHGCCNHTHATRFTVCDTCGQVEEIGHDHHTPQAIEIYGFTPSRIITEIHGICMNCLS